MRYLLKGGIALSMLLLSALVLRAQQIIDFENLNADFGLVEGSSVFDQYDDGDCGVRFYIGDPANNQYPVLAQVGGPRVAFEGPNLSSPDCGINTATRNDMPLPSANAGCWFLTDDGVTSASSDELRVIYNSPTYECSGTFLDIDGGEVWTIDAYFQGNIVATLSITDTDPNTGDGVGTNWEIVLPTAGDPLDELRITVTKPGSIGIGIAFDNFSACERLDANCCPGDNFVDNGSFNGGNSGFLSSYNYTPLIGPNSVLQGQYTIANNAQASLISNCWNALDPVSCDPGDPFMVVNGSTCDNNNTVVYAQGVQLKPNQTYQFCAYFKNLANCCFNADPEVTVQITGATDIEATISTTSDPCDWVLLTREFTTGGGGGLTSVSISLQGQQGFDGNDLAIDEISLKQLEPVAPSVVAFGVVPNTIPNNPNFFNVTATPSASLPDGCVDYWEVCELDLSNNCIPGTEVFNPAPWQTFITNFPGYVGLNALVGGLPGVFDYNKRWRIVRGVECECTTERRLGWTWEPNPRFPTLGSGYFAYFDRLPNGDLQEIPGTRVNGNIFSVVKNKRLMQGGDQLDLEVIPNPAHDEALLRFSIPGGQAAELEITDLEGKTLFEVPVAAGQIGLQERQLDLRELPAGVYLVRLNSKQHNLVQKLLIQ